VRRREKGTTRKKRYTAGCANHRCGRRYETDNPKAVNFVCECGERLTWNDNRKLVTVEPWMLENPDFRVETR